VAEKKSLQKAIVATVILALLTAALNAFLSSPPTRAEFESLKVETRTERKYIKERLDDLKDGQMEILRKL
jgi:hypothetical protein